MNPTRLERRLINRAREPQIRAELDARRPRVTVIDSRPWLPLALGLVGLVAVGMVVL